MVKLTKLSPLARQILNYLVVSGSVLLCLLLLPTRLPGMQLLGIGPHWTVIWVVSWSVKRTSWSGALAGMVLGSLQDFMNGVFPVHFFSLSLVGALTARLQKRKYIQEDFISIALIVFGMTLLAETVTAIIYGWQYRQQLNYVWSNYQHIALAASLLSSLWAPVVHYPLNLWWERIRELEQPH